MSKTIKWYAKPIYVMFALALVLSFGLVTAVPLAAAGTTTTTLTVPNNVYRPAEFVASSTTTNSGTAYTNVRFNITVDGPVAFTGDRADTFTITKVNGSSDTQGINDTFVLVVGDWVGYWGPTGGFPLPDPYSATSIFTIEMCDTGTAPLGGYDVTVELVNLIPDPDVQLSEATDSFTLSTTASVTNINTGEGFNSIQAAIDDSDTLDGHTINVAAGTYEEAITIDKRLTLMAASKPVIDCSDRATLGLAKTDGCIEITADNVVIQGFKLIGYDPTGESWSDQKSSSKFSTIKVTSGADGLKVKDNEFTGTSKAAVGLLIDEDCDDVEFTGNTVTDYLQGVVGHKNVDNLLVEDNEFTIPIAENTALDPDEAYGYGVQLWHGNNLQVINNTFTGSWDTVTGDYEDPDALCNHYAVSTFTTYFASAYGWPDIVGDIHIKDNEMTNLYLGVGSFAGGGEIENNKSIHDNLLGIQLGQVSGTWATAPTAGLSITGNDIKNNKRGIWAQSFIADGIAAHFNNIVGNTEYGIINEDPEDDDFDAENNWWGDASGPTHAGNPGGTGDVVSDNVDYDPWLGAELTEVKAETISGSGTMTDTAIGGTVTINGDGDHTITTSVYTENPGGACPFTNEGSYYDIHLDSADGVTSLTVQFCPALEGEIITYWDGTSWVAASNQVYADGCITVTITDETIPSLSDLTGTPFGQGFMPPVGGEAYPVSQVNLTLPWIAFAIAITAGIGIISIMRHRAHSKKAVKSER